MGKESLQKQLSRVRKPRVHITYDVETGGAIEKREIPFMVGVMADLSGNPQQPLPPISNRKFVEVNRDSLDTVLSKVSPRLAFKVDNRLGDDGTRLGIELHFEKMNDFSPAEVAKQVPALRHLLEMRNALQNLRSSLQGNDKLEGMLQTILKDPEALRRMAAEAASPRTTASTDQKE